MPLKPVRKGISMWRMKPRARLPRLLMILLAVEAGCFVLCQFSDSRRLAEWEGSAFDHFWDGTWYLLAGLWLVGWVAVLRAWKRAFEIYAAGWIAALCYLLLSGPWVESAWAEFLSTLSSAAGGALLVLTWLRKADIGDWSKPSIQAMDAAEASASSGS